MKKCTKCLQKYPLEQFSKRNSSTFRSWCKLCRNQDAKIRQQKIKLDVLSHYSSGKPKCSCCKETKSEFLTIDHVKNNGCKLRREDSSHNKIYRWIIKNNYPKKMFRVLCMNCNFSIGLYGYCPHTKTNHVHKLNPDQVREIRERKEHGETIKEIANDYPVNESSIRNVCAYKTWKDI